MPLTDYHINYSNWREINRVGSPSDAIQVASGEIIKVNHGLKLLVDAHMHIQSNNCCPLPLQWAIASTNIHELVKPIDKGEISEKGRDIQSSRRILNDTTASKVVSKIATGRLGKIGRLSTDLIAKVFFGTAQTDDMNTACIWTVLTPEERKTLYPDGYEKDKKKTNSPAKDVILFNAGERARLESLADETSEDLTVNFMKTVQFYLSNFSSGSPTPVNPELTRMHIAMPMDM